MHHTEATLIRLGTEVRRNHREDAWSLHLHGHAGAERVLVGSLAFDAAYWSAQAVEAVLEVLRAALEAAYEL